MVTQLRTISTPSSSNVTGNTNIHWSDEERAGNAQPPHESVSAKTTRTVFTQISYDESPFSAAASQFRGLLSFASRGTASALSRVFVGVADVVWRRCDDQIKNRLRPVGFSTAHHRAKERMIWLPALLAAPLLPHASVTSSEATVLSIGLWEFASEYPTYDSPWNGFGQRVRPHPDVRLAENQATKTNHRLHPDEAGAFGFVPRKPALLR